MEGEETFDSSSIGYADEVIEERISDDDVILLKGTKNTSAVSTSSLSLYGFLNQIHLRKWQPLFLTFVYLFFLSQVSLILRGANDFMLDEMERALHDAICIVKRTLESNMVKLVISAFFLILDYHCVILGTHSVM